MPSTALDPSPSSFASSVIAGVGIPKDGDTHSGPLDFKKPGQQEPPDDAAKKAESDRIAGEADAAAKKEAEEAAKVVKETKPEEGKKADLSNPNLRGEDQVEKEVARPKGMDEKTFQGWSKIQKERESAVRERDSLKEELDKIKSESSNPNAELEAARKELEAVKKSLAEYEGEISVSRVEATPDFKKNVTGPIKQITDDIAELAKRYDVPAKGLMDAISETDPSRRADLIEEATADFKGVDKLDVVQSAKEYVKAQRTASEYRENAKGKLEEIERRSKGDEERVSTENKQQYQSAAQRAWEKRLAETPTVKKVDGADDWNSLLDATGKKIAEINVNDLDLTEVADMASAREMVPFLTASVTHLQAELKKSQAETKAEKDRNAAYLKGAPGAGGGHAGSSNGSTGSGKGRLLADNFPIKR